MRSEHATTTESGGQVKFVCKRPVQNAALRLFCFPYAGGGVTAFRNWPHSLPVTVETHILDMPGREARIREPGFVQVESLVRAVDVAIRPYLQQPFVFFGHSMGALVSFEVARMLRRQHSIEPRALFLSGRGAPQLPIELTTYNLPHDEFIQDLRLKGGTPEEVLTHPELLDLLIPVLRSDFQLCQTYEYHDEPPLTCQITALGGLNDEFVPREDLEQWREQTSGPFQVRMFPGDHFFLHSAQLQLLQMLARDLVQVIQTLPRQ
jgi:medium-chain acyl-[acyl-carrier-protein] hydrolase